MMKDKFQLYARFIKLLLPQRGKWFLVLITSVAGALLGLVIPYLTKEVVDTAINKRDFKAFVFYAIISGSIFIVAESLNWLRYWLERIIKTKLSFDLHKKIFQHLQGLSYGWFQDKTTGEHIFKLNYDIDAVVEFITGVLPQVLFIVPRAVFIVAIVCYLNWKMALCALFLAPFLFLPNYFYNRVMEKLSQQLVESSEKVLVFLQEMFSHIQLIKVWGAEKRNRRNFLHRLITNVRIHLSYLKPEVVNGILVQVITKLIIGLISLFGGYLVIKGEMTLGSLTAIMVYLVQLAGLQAQFAGFLMTSISGTVSCGRLVQILDAQPQIRDSAQAQDVEFKNGDIIFKDVSFGYRQGEAVLKNISFSIKGGQHIALVGASGLGKTTILNLLVRLYELWQGEISIDGYDIHSIKLQSLKNQVGVALQEPLLWDDTIFNNIAYCSNRATLQEIEKISRIAQVDDFVKKLPLGYQTIIGENACKISEGQKQRIAIARVLFKNPKIIIFDEAMSSLDSSSEERILANLKQHYKDMTVIIVSHRLSTVKKCDKIYYLAAADKLFEGDVVGLLKTNTDLRRLFAGQLSGEENFNL